MNEFLKKKKEAKKELSKKLSFSAKKPLLGVFLEKELSKSEVEALKQVLEGTSSIGVEVIILADSNLDMFSAPHTIVLPYGRVNRKTLLNAVDISLGFSFNDIEEMLLHGIIPICHVRPEVQDYNPNKETGNSFVYHDQNHWSMFAALVRAIETFKFPYDWRHIVREGVNSARG